MIEAGHVSPCETPSAEETEELSFLARWSRRKLGQEDPLAAKLVEADPPVPVREAQPAASIEPGEPIDARTGKPMSELTDEDMPAIESLDENSDLAAFMAGKVSSALRMKALTKVFHTAKFNQVCLCAEYAEDYTNFVPLGDIVPHDLRQAIVREANKLCEQLAEKGIRITPDEAQARVAAEYRGERPARVEEVPTATIAPENGLTGQALARPAEPSAEPMSPDPLSDDRHNRYSDRTMPPGNEEAT